MQLWLINLLLPQKMNKSGLSQKPYWDSQNSRRDPSDPIIAAFAIPKVSLISKHTLLPKDALIIDIGCGNGYFTYYLSKLSQTIGIDFSYNMLKQNPCENLFQASSTKLPFKDNSFNMVFCSNLLHHLENWELDQTLLEMKRISKQYVVLSEPNRYNPLMMMLGLVKKEERKSLQFCEKFLQNKITSSGLSVVYSETSGFVTPNRMPKLLVSILKKFNTPNPLAAYTVIISEKIN